MYIYTLPHGLLQGCDSVTIALHIMLVQLQPSFLLCFWHVPMSTMNCLQRTQTYWREHSPRQMPCICNKQLIAGTDSFRLLRIMACCWEERVHPRGCMHSRRRRKGLACDCCWALPRWLSCFPGRLLPSLSPTVRSPTWSHTPIFLATLYTWGHLLSIGSVWL